MSSSVHAERLGTKDNKAPIWRRPRGVAYDAVEHARPSTDVVLIDTAGRMQTNVNLMDEMKKIKRVVSLTSSSSWGLLAGNDAVNGVALTRPWHRRHHPDQDRCGRQGRRRSVDRPCHRKAHSVREQWPGVRGHHTFRRQMDARSPVRGMIGGLYPLVLVDGFWRQ